MQMYLQQTRTPNLARFTRKRKQALLAKMQRKTKVKIIARKNKRSNLISSHATYVQTELRKKVKTGERFFPSSFVGKLDCLAHYSEEYQRDILSTVCAHLAKTQQLNKQGRAYFWETHK